MKEKLTDSSTHPPQEETPRDSSWIIDHDSLELQIEKARSVLEMLSRSYSFDSLSHFSVLAELIEQDGGSMERAETLLENWPYSSPEFMKRHHAGNCVDFAICAQIELAKAGIPTMIIGKLPDSNEYSPTQINYMKYRHVSLLYVNGLSHFMFEPGWKLPQAIRLDPGIRSKGNDWEFETKKLDGNTLIQQTYNVHKKKVGERVFDTRPVSREDCQSLTKRLTRIPRKMERLNRLSDDHPTVALRFNPETRRFTTSVPGVPKEFIPDELSKAHTDLLVEALELNEVATYMKRIRDLSVLLPEHFWIK